MLLDDDSYMLLYITFHIMHIYEGGGAYHYFVNIIFGSR